MPHLLAAALHCLANHIEDLKADADPGVEFTTDKGQMEKLSMSRTSDMGLPRSRVARIFPPSWSYASGTRVSEIAWSPTATAPFEPAVFIRSRRRARRCRLRFREVFAQLARASGRRETATCGPGSL